MMQLLNEKFKGVFAWIIGILIAFSFGFIGVGQFFEGTTAEKKAAVVNGETIPTMEFDRAFERVRMQTQQATGKVITDQELLNNMRNELLTNLIKQKVLYQSAKNYGMSYSDEQINNFIAYGMPMFQEKGKFSQDRLNQVLRTYNYSPQSFKNEVGSQLLIQQLQKGIVLSSFTSTSDIKLSYALTKEKRDARYVRLTVEDFGDGITITDDAIKAYYQANQNEFIEPEKVSIEYIKLSYDELKQKIKPSEIEQKSYYESNKENYKTPPQWTIAHILIGVRSNDDDKSVKAAEEKINKIHQELTSGKDFKALAKQHSDDAVTKNNGGVLPKFKLGTLDPDIEREMMRLQQVNDFSKPFRSKYGFEIIKLIAKKPAVQQSFEQNRERITQSLIQEAAQKQFAELSDELASLSFTNPTSLQPAADKLRLPIQTSKPFPRQNKSNDLTGNPRVITAAFSADVKDMGNNSDLLALDQSSAAVIRVKQHQPQRLKTLEEVKTKILMKLKFEKMQENALKFAKRLQKNAGKKSQQDLLQARKIGWVNQHRLTRETAELDSKINEAIFSIPSSKDKTQQNAVAHFSNGDVAYIEVTHISPADISQLEQSNVKHIAREIFTHYGLLEHALYVKSIEDNAKVEKFIKDKTIDAVA